MLNWRSVSRIPAVAVLVLSLALSALPQSSSNRQATSSQGGQNSSAPAKPARPAIKPEPKKAQAAYKQGLRAEHDGNWQAAYDSYSDALSWAPNEREYFQRVEIAKAHIVQEKMDLAEREAVSGRLSEALRLLISARSLDPSNRVLQARYAELSALFLGQLKPAASGQELAGPVHLEYAPGKRNFNIRGDTQSAYNEIARQFGVEVAFDVDLRSRVVRFQINDLDFPTALRLIGEQTGTFWRPLTKHLFLVAEDTTQKRKDYALSVVRTVMLPASETTEQMTEIFRLVREIAGITRADLDTRSGTITMRASPQALAVATGLIEDLENPAGELILEIEVLEVDRNYARQLGITPPQTTKVFTLSRQQVQEALQSQQGLIDVITQVFGTPSSLAGLTATQIASLLGSGQVSVASLIPPLVAFGGGSTTFLATMPGATANFSEMLSLVRTGRRILLRAEDGKPATFFVGERFPVALAQFSPSLAGTAEGVAGLVSGNLPTTALTTGAAPVFVTTADVRGTSLEDIIVANNTDNTLSLFLSNGDGTFAAPTTAIPTGTGPVWITSANFNPTVSNDLHLDIAVVNHTANTISILLGNGDGTFQPKTDISTGTGTGPVAAVAATLTSSGFADLVVANNSNDTLGIFLGNGDGTFKAPTFINTGHAPSSIAAADLNGDGHIDLVVTNQNDNTVSVFLGNGDGTFKTRTDYAVGTAPVWVSTGDFSGDGFLDLAVANNTDNTVSILTGVGDGTFQAQTIFPAGNGPTSLAVADFNVDGRLDILAADQTDNAVSVLLNLGSGLFGPNFELPVGTNPVGVAAADFDANGAPDAVTADKGSNTATVILNNSTFSGATNPLAASAFPGVEYLDIGTKVKATARIHPNDEVTLHLNLEISSLSAQSFNGIPVISNESMEQTIRLRENETTMVMGIRQPQVSTSLNGSPGISSIPGIGLLDSLQGKTDQDSDLLVLITPRMVELAPRKDHVIYAGRGAPEGQGGAFGGRGIDRGNERVPVNQGPQPQVPVRPLPQPPPEPEPNPENDAPPQPPQQP
ncbi:MAG: FG-GAP-like repeat-containing protein [Candidatus Acidiferrales bacterium]